MSKLLLGRFSRSYEREYYIFHVDSSGHNTAASHMAMPKIRLQPAPTEYKQEQRYIYSAADNEFRILLLADP